ncbi:MAG: hypothetical protein ED557_02165 [Balneola sp.]|nr:MAG: hypothetical protein ED557_02165 [Balneola sp.]
MNKPIVLRAYQNTNEAYANKCLLEDAGITVFLYDEYTPSTLPSPSSGTKIVVPEYQVEEALLILDQNFKENHPDLYSDEDTVRCPKCDSKRIFLMKNRLTLARLIFSITFFFFKDDRKRYQCRDCRNTWREF